MACGNNHVSRDHLASQPSSPKTAANALSKSQIQAAIDAHRLPNVRIDDDKPRQAFQSRSSRGVVDYFVGADGQQTHDPALHVHVIHKTNGNVTLEITNRRDLTRSSQIELKSPDGNQVREAEKALAEVLRSLR